MKSISTKDELQMKLAAEKSEWKSWIKKELEVFNKLKDDLSYLLRKLTEEVGRASAAFSDRLHALNKYGVSREHIAFLIERASAEVETLAETFKTWIKNLDTLIDNLIDLLKDIKGEPDELSEEFKDAVLDNIETARIPPTPPTPPTPPPKEMPELKPEKELKKKITIPKVTPPTVKGPPKPHTHAQDSSLPELQNLLQMGYTHCTWHLSDAHVITDICDELNNQTWTLEEFLSGLSHSAPLYERGHPGDLCYVTVISQTNPELPPVNVNAGNRWA